MSVEAVAGRFSATARAGFAGAGSWPRLSSGGRLTSVPAKKSPRGQKPRVFPRRLTQMPQIRPPRHEPWQIRQQILQRVHPGHHRPVRLRLRLHRDHVFIRHNHHIHLRRRLLCERHQRLLHRSRRNRKIPRRAHIHPRLRQAPNPQHNVLPRGVRHFLHRILEPRPLELHPRHRHRQKLCIMIHKRHPAHLRRPKRHAPHLRRHLHSHSIPADKNPPRPHHPPRRRLRDDKCVDPPQRRKLRVHPQRHVPPVRRNRRRHLQNRPRRKRLHVDRSRRPRTPGRKHLPAHRHTGRRNRRNRSKRQEPRNPFARAQRHKKLPLKKQNNPLPLAPGGAPAAFIRRSAWKMCCPAPRRRSPHAPISARSRSGTPKNI